MAKVSIIVPIYKVERYVERCSRSLFEQTLDEIEYIFVDDCSPDNSINVIKKVLADYPNRESQVKFVHHKENKGLTAARNTGLYHSTGLFVAHCDSDDWVEKDMYESLYNKAIIENSDVVICDFIMEFATESKPYRTVEVCKDKALLLKNFIVTGWPVIWNILAKRSLYFINNLKSPEHITYCEDFFLAIRLLYYAEKVSKVTKYLHHYNRTNNTSLLNDLSVKSIADEYTCNIETYNFFQKNNNYGTYEKEMSWRILRCQKERVLNPDRHQVFVDNAKFAHKYIWSCPFINIKMKIMMWMLVHKCRGLVRVGLKFRSVFTN